MSNSPFVGYPGQVWGAAWQTMSWFLQFMNGGATPAEDSVSAAEVTFRTMINGIQAVTAWQVASALDVEAQLMAQIEVLPLALDAPTAAFFNARIAAVALAAQQIALLPPSVDLLASPTICATGQPAIPDPGFTEWCLQFAGETPPNDTTMPDSAATAATAWQTIAAAIAVLQGDATTAAYDAAMRMWRASNLVATKLTSLTSDSFDSGPTFVPMTDGLGNVLLDSYGAVRYLPDDPSWPGVANYIDRIQRNSIGTYFDATGTMQTALPNVPRYNYDPVTNAPLGLLIETRRTNVVRNSTNVGAVIGTPGTLPTTWTRTTGGGITTSVVGFGTDSGIPYIDIRCFGTPSPGSVDIVMWGSNTMAPALTGQTWTISSYLKLQAGSLTNVSSLTFRVSETTVTGVAVGGVHLGATFTPTSAALSSQRFSSSVLFTGGATVASMTGGFHFSTTTALAIDFTIRIGGAQIEQAASASSFIPSSTVAVTREADVPLTGLALTRTGWNQLVALPTLLTDASTLMSAPSTLVNQQCAVIRHALGSVAWRMARFLMSLRRSQIGTVSTASLRNHETLMDLAARTSGDFEDWANIAAINGLRPPYPGPGNNDSVGTTLMLPMAGTPVPAIGAPLPSYAINVLGTDYDFGPINTVVNGQLAQGVMPAWTGDFNLITGYGNFRRAIGRRLQTTLGTLLYHTDYGSRIPPEVGAIQTVDEAVKLAVFARSAITADPRTGSIVHCNASVVPPFLASVAAVIQPVGSGSSPVSVNEVLSPLP